MVGREKNECNRESNRIESKQLRKKRITRKKCINKGLIYRKKEEEASFWVEERNVIQRGCEKEEEKMGTYCNTHIAS